MERAAAVGASSVAGLGLVVAVWGEAAVEAADGAPSAEAARGEVAGTWPTPHRRHTAQIAARSPPSRACSTTGQPHRLGCGSSCGRPGQQEEIWHACVCADGALDPTSVGKRGPTWCARRCRGSRHRRGVSSTHCASESSHHGPTRKPQRCMQHGTRRLQGARPGSRSSSHHHRNRRHPSCKGQ